MPDVTRAGGPSRGRRGGGATRSPAAPLDLWRRFPVHSFGHDLDPAAPFKVEPFMPAFFGRKQIANFATEAWPGAGSRYLATFAGGVFAVLTYQLVVGRRRAVREAAA